MAKPQTDEILRRNQFLGAFERDVRNKIDAHLRPVNLKLGDIVCEAGGVLKHVCFPEGGVLSLLTLL